MLAIAALWALLDEQAALGGSGEELAVFPAASGDRPRPLKITDDPNEGRSFPKMTVPMADSQPPEPQAKATSASGTWASPASPRSWRTASINKKMPRMPGWLDDKPPPSVLVGIDPPRRRWPSVT